MGVRLLHCLKRTDIAKHIFIQGQLYSCFFDVSMDLIAPLQEANLYRVVGLLIILYVHQPAVRYFG
jgi:hypothetical protein